MSNAALSRARHIRWQPRLLALAAAAACAGNAFAQAKESTMEEVVVSASGFEQELKNAPASISVVTRQELETKNFRDLAEAAFAAVTEGRSHDELTAYEQSWKDSWVYKDLSRVRNVKPLWSRFGTYFGIGLGALDMWTNQLFGFSLFGANFQPWVVMVLPPGGFIVLGAWLLLFSALKRRQEARLATQGGSHGA